MKKQPGKWRSMLGLKCPKCRSADMFKPIKTFKNLFEMHDNCPNCGQKFELEIGFYWGAMYIAYGISSFFCLVSFVLAFWGFGWTEYQAFAFLVVIVMLLSPYTFRLARAIWLYAFVRYKPDELNN